MDEQTRNRILARKDEIVGMVLERAKRDFPQDIALIGLSGSFSTGDYHEHSDVDLIIVNNTDRGWDISYCFVLDGVGYDIYCTPWKPRIEAAATLESPNISSLIELEVLYCADPAHMETLRAYQQQAGALLAQPVGRDSLERAEPHLKRAKESYAQAMLWEESGKVRHGTLSALYHLVNALVRMNNIYINRGIKRYREQLANCAYLPKGFFEQYDRVTGARSITEQREAAGVLLRGVLGLYETMWQELVEKPVPTYENLWGTYEELWCNCRNKILDSIAAGDASYLCHAALGAQDYLNEMAELFGTPAFDLLGQFDPGDPHRFGEWFLQVMEAYRQEYDKVGRTPEVFHSFEEVYRRFNGSRGK